MYYFFAALTKYDDVRFYPALFIAFTTFGFFVQVLLAEALNMVQTEILGHSSIPSAKE